MIRIVGNSITEFDLRTIYLVIPGDGA